MPQSLTMIVTTTPCRQVLPQCSILQALVTWLLPRSQIQRAASGPPNSALLCIILQWDNLHSCKALAWHMPLALLSSSRQTPIGAFNNPAGSCGLPHAATARPSPVPLAELGILQGKHGQGRLWRRRGQSTHMPPALLH